MALNNRRDSGELWEKLPKEHYNYIFFWPVEAWIFSPNLSEMKTYLERQLSSQVLTLTNYARDNAEFFFYDSSDNGRKLLNASLEMGNNLEGFAEKLLKIDAEAYRFDFKETAPANGYRSFVNIGIYALDYGINLNQEIKSSRSSFFFRKSKFAKHLHSYSELLDTLHTCFRCLHQMISWSSADGLFVDGGHTFRELFAQEKINLHCFYGRCMGFQFSNEMRQILTSIVTTMTIYSTYFFSHGSFFCKLFSIFSAPKYLIDHEQRADQLINVFQNASADFCKSFWNFSDSDFLNTITFSNRMTVNRLITISPEALVLDVDGSDINIPIPTSHIGEKPIQARLISNKKYKGMIGTSENDNSINNPSSGLIIHCHSGGYIALTSRSHLSYLKTWAKAIDAPILSIDYSLAPEAPYPRALEEVFYVYCWALKNLNLLGTTGDRIVFVGDSAGGNIILAATLKCIALGIPLPSGLCPVYANTGRVLLPSPGRFLSVLDPLIPFTFLLVCVRAYICGKECAVYCTNQDAGSKSKQTVEATFVRQKNKPSTLVDKSLYEKQEKHQETLTEQSLTVDPNSDQYHKPSSSGINDGTFTEISLEPTVELVFDEPSTSGSNTPLEKTDDAQENVDVLPETVSESEKSFDFAKFMQFPDPADDPYLCPLLASDEFLRKFPPVKAVTAEMDPFIDDSVMFCKKLKKLGTNVSLEVIPKLGHGFLNLATSSDKANEGCQIVARKLSELLNLENAL